MSARDEILGRVRAARPAPLPPPDVAAAVGAFARRETTGELAGRFADAARAAGAEVIEGTRADLAGLVAAARRAGERIVSEMPDVPETIPMPDDPRRLADLDLLVCEASLGVAENGAVWLAAPGAGRRAALFLAGRVVVALDRIAIVPDLHAAYARIDPRADGFGVLVAGPSKTADIEQSLVIGAHGPRALAVVLLSDPTPGHGSTDAE